MKKLLVLVMALTFLSVPAQAGAVSFDITQVTNDVLDDKFPSLYDGTIAYQKRGGTADHEIYYWNGSTHTNISDNDTNDFGPSLYDGTIAWHGKGTLQGDSTAEILYWDGNEELDYDQVTTDGALDQCPSLYDGTIAWRKAGGTSGVYYWDGINSPTLISTNVSGAVEAPSLYNGMMAWTGHDGHDLEIYHGNAIGSTNISDKDDDDYAPSLYQDKVAWAGYDGNDYEIYYYDGATTTQVTDNAYNDLAPSLYNGAIAWHQKNGNYYDIFYWDGTITQVTDNNSKWIDDMYPSLYDGNIAWQSEPSGGDFDIFYATQIPDLSAVFLLGSASLLGFCIMRKRSQG